MDKLTANAAQATTLNKEEAKSETPRPRRGTLIKLQWLAEQVRKSLRIKDMIDSGDYSVDSRNIARAILNKQEE